MRICLRIAQRSASTKSECCSWAVQYPASNQLRQGADTQAQHPDTRKHNVVLVERPLKTIYMSMEIPCTPPKGRLTICVPFPVILLLGIRSNPPQLDKPATKEMQPDSRLHCTVLSKTHACVYNSRRPSSTYSGSQYPLLLHQRQRRQELDPRVLCVSTLVVAVVVHRRSSCSGPISSSTREVVSSLRPPCSTTQRAISIATRACVIRSNAYVHPGMNG